MSSFVTKPPVAVMWRSNCTSLTTPHVLQGAKNHGVVMPDANKENTLNQLVGAAFGAAGQRCMALSTAILVGEARNWLPELVERSKALRVNAGTAPHQPTPPFISVSPEPPYSPLGLSV